ncbi:MAG: imidazole glycerol phosphate synthase subunit HisH [Ignavibacteriaceae bacterium]|nr:imidazole glycerol phosphate synthase subunit HisH [Ignavibacteriaceae bacterium]
MIALIDYGAGNTASVSNVLKDLNVEFILTNEKKEIDRSEKIILPGVGEASSAMLRLKELELIEYLKNTTKPFLGICLGMQLLCESTEEGNTDCLKLLPITVKKITSKNLKIPHMGWNSIKKINDSKLLIDVDDNQYFYFAHSFFVPQSKFTTSVCNYEFNFSASIQLNNFFGVQFHPEKSSMQGVTIIKNFIEKC